MNNISIYNLLRLPNPIIIDIRYEYDYNIGNIPNSINIPYYKLQRNYKYYLNNIDTYYLYCDYGDKSKEICNKLLKYNYNVINVEGGYNNYINDKNHFILK